MSMYELKQWDGKTIAITDKQAVKIAQKAGLIPVDVNGQIHYLNKSDIASIRPNNNLPRIDRDKQIEAPDFRGVPSPAKEEMRKKIKDWKKTV